MTGRMPGKLRQGGYSESYQQPQCEPQGIFLRQVAPEECKQHSPRDNLRNSICYQRTRWPPMRYQYYANSDDDHKAYPLSKHHQPCFAHDIQRGLMNSGAQNAYDDVEEKK